MSLIIMECATCKENLTKEEIDTYLTDWDKENCQLFYEKYYCPNCIQDAVDTRIMESFNSGKYEEILEIVKIAEKLDFFSFEYDSQSIILVLASFITLNRLEEALNFWDMHQ